MDNIGELGRYERREVRKLLVLGVFALVLFLGLVWLRLPATQSRWTHVEREGRKYYLQKALPASLARALPAAFPSRAGAWLESLGLGKDSYKDLPPTIIASWGSYASLGADDPLLVKTLLPEAATGFRALANLSQSLRLNEPVVSTYVTPDGDYLFIDLRQDSLFSQVHALAHVLARSHRPSAPAPASDETRAWSLLDEGTALFLGDLAASANVAASASANVAASPDLEAYAAYLATRYAPEGPLFADPEGAFLFSDGDTSPEDYKALAELFLGLCRSRGLRAVEAWALDFLQGRYADIEGHCASLGLDYRNLP